MRRARRLPRWQAMARDNYRPVRGDPPPDAPDDASRSAFAQAREEARRLARLGPNQSQWLTLSIIPRQ
jgi:hypothetical protein